MDPELQKLIDRGVDDGLDDADIGLLVEAFNEHKAKASPAAKPNVFQQGVGDSLGQMATGAVKEVGSLGRSAINAVLHPIDTATGAIDAQVNTFNKAKTAPTLSEKVGYGLASAIPLVGPMLANAGEQLGSGDPETMGRGFANSALAVTGASPTIRAGIGSAGSAVGSAAAKVPGMGKVAGAVKGAAQNPLAAAVGGYEGYQAAGVPGAVLGALGAPIGVRGLARELGKALRPEAVANPNVGGTLKPKTPVGDAVQEALDELRTPAAQTPALPGIGPAQGSSTRTADGVAGSSVKRTGQDPRSLLPKVDTKPQPAPSHVATAPSIASHQVGDVNWRTTDAVPIDAITRAHGQPGGSILQAGESQPGLIDALLQQAKDPATNAAEIEALARALRQRQHIADYQASAPAPVSGGTPTLRDQLEATLRFRGGK